MNTASTRDPRAALLVPNLCICGRDPSGHPLGFPSQKGIIFQLEPDDSGKGDDDGPNTVSP